jgi:hypothetical protein
VSGREISTRAGCPLRPPPAFFQQFSIKKASLGGPAPSLQIDDSRLLAVRRAGASTAILTTPEGELLGIVRASDLPDES